MRVCVCVSVCVCALTTLSEAKRKKHSATIAARRSDDAVEERLRRVLRKGVGTKDFEVGRIAA